MQDSQLEEIKSRLNITDVLSEYIQLRKAGVNYKAVCPFHSEKTPSFVVSPVKQIWHCFGCGLGGDIFEFVKQIENVEFAQALRILADKAGVELRKPTVNELKLRDKKDLLVEINEAAAAYFEKVLWESNAGKEALDYLRGRGLSDGTIKKWRLGYAPNDFHYLENFLSKKYTKNDIVEGGLIIRKDDGTYFDRFHDRIMFPIWNYLGGVVGFTGRILKPQENTGKYVNSPDSPIYNKSFIIYGLNFAKNGIRKEDRAVIVEGNMDVIASHQAGFTQAIATSGTAFTGQQIETVGKLTNNIVFAMDGDSAGADATQKVLELALTMGINAKVAVLNQAKDPDELIKKGIALWTKAIDGAIHFIDFSINKLIEKVDITQPEGIEKLESKIIPLISYVTNPVIRAFYVRKLANQINVPERTILERLNEKGQPQVQTIEKQPIIKKDRRTNLEDQLLGLSLNLKTIEYVKNSLSEDFSEGNREVIRAIQQTGNAKIENLKKQFPNLSSKLDLLSFAVEIDNQQEDLDSKKQIEVISRELNKLVLKQKMEETANKMAEAQRVKDEKLLAELSTKFKGYSQEISKIQ